MENQRGGVGHTRKVKANGDAAIPRDTADLIRTV